MRFPPFDDEEPPTDCEPSACLRFGIMGDTIG